MNLKSFLRNLLFATAVAQPVSSLADDNPSMVVLLNSNEQTSYEIQTISRITYSDDQMTITFSDNSTYVVSVDDVDYMSFSNVDAPVTSALSLTQSSVALEYVVTDLAGRVVARGVSTNPVAECSRAGLSHGLYLVSAAGFSLRVIVK